MIIYNEGIYILAVVVRVLFLVLFCGANLWFMIAFRTGTEKLPPPQRLELVRTVERRFISVSWVFIALMTAAGFGTITVTSVQLSLNSVFSTSAGLVLGLEAVVTLLIIIVNALIQFAFLPRARKALITTSESADKALKWLTVKDGPAALQANRNIAMLVVLNIVLAIIAISLGVVFSSL